ncbi:MAG: LLM class flavin-dependent oxidoreductase [Chloroflexi bacterium]|nr:LLM class flavin-dependent oxidoreductase [Chloroflexota bacterium]
MVVVTHPDTDRLSPTAETQVAERTAQRAGLKLGFLTRLEVGADPADSYKFGLEMFDLAEELGYDTGWIAQHHFLNGAGRLPSVFPFLAAAAQRTKRINLGTAVVTLPLEDPLRVAEDAAFVDVISGGRLQLGVGTGGDPLSFNAFGKDVNARREAYADGLRLIKTALTGQPVNGTTAVMYPTAPSLVDRIWEATFSVDGGGRIGKNGSGLLLARTSAHSGDPADVVQAPIAELYQQELEPLGIAPRVGMSRTVYVAADRATAMEHLRSGVEHWIEVLSGRGQFPTGLTLEQAFKRIHIHYGHPEEVIESIRDDKLFAMSTELICQVQPGDPTQKQILKSMELLATQVAPALGWKPNRG